MVHSCVSNMSSLVAVCFTALFGVHKPQPHDSSGYHAIIAVQITLIYAIVWCLPLDCIFEFSVPPRFSATGVYPSLPDVIIMMIIHS
jgi:hypothetical protein